MLSSDTQRLSVKAVTLSNNCCLLGRSIADSVAILPDRTWVEGSARIEIPNPFPLTFSRKSGKYLLNVPRNSGGLGSKITDGIHDILPKCSTLGVREFFILQCYISLSLYCNMSTCIHK